MEYLLSLIIGTLYGFAFGIIPVAGTTTALIVVYGFLDIFRADPYLLVVFTTAVVVSSAIGDSFSSIMLNIPGAGGSAATMIDGFPMMQRGEGTRALSAAVFTSTLNGILWGIIVFAFLPYYKQVVLYFAIPEMLAFILLAFTCIVFISGSYWVRGIIAVLFGLFLGLIGQDPITGAARFTGGWYYLRDGIQIAPIMAGILAMPELIEAYRTKLVIPIVSVKSTWQQIKHGLIDTWLYKWDGFRGGFIGAIIGLLPGVGGAIADWIAYGQTIAINKKEAFGNGNVRGVIGCEGANNAQKATSYVPTILFGIPGAPFEVIIMSLFVIVGLELGSPELLNNNVFFDIIFESYLLAISLTLMLSILVIRYATLIALVPFRYYFFLLVALITWSCVQYTGYWEDYAVLAICTVIGLCCKKFKINRAAIIIGYVLSHKTEMLFIQYSTLYEWHEIFMRPISLSLLIVAAIAVVYGIFINKNRLTYY